MSKTVPVAVAISRPIPETYTYLLPENLQSGTLVGCRVVVPLGRSRVVGIIWKTDVEVSAAIKPKLKKIIHRLDSSPLLPAAVIELIKWTADYYAAPPGMVATAAFPPGLQGGAVRLIQINENSILKKYTGNRKTITYKELLFLLPESISIDSLLARESAVGLVNTWWSPAKKPPEKTIPIVEPLVKAEILIKAGHSLKKRSPKQAALLSTLSLTGPIPKKELFKAARAGTSSLERLKQLKLVKITQKKVSRDPLLHAESLENKPVPKLNQYQTDAINTILQKKEGTFLLHGITGSGKTEVYLKLIQFFFKNNKQAIILVPEISLTPLAVSRFNTRFPGQVAVLHSGLSKGERLDTWNLVQQGKRNIVIGPRSAVFAPLTNLGIIVVDEEHDDSYKQSSTPRYNGRDLAIVRGTIEKIPVILGSASPSAESWLNAKTGKYTLVSLPERATKRQLPSITLVDSNKEKFPLLSRQLLAAIGKRTALGEQSIILINRRGHSPIQMCTACGHVEQCPACEISMTYHKKGEVLRCHHCGNWKSAKVRCPKCHGEEYKRQGPGIQKVEEALGELLPRTKIIRMDADTTSTKSAHWKIIKQFTEGEGDVLLGTQMVAKGHDFPGVTLAAVIGAEMSLYMPDFRAQERTFNLLLQLAGRAGRGDKPGEVIIQTTAPENTVIQQACRHDYTSFIKDEIAFRKELSNPPITRMCRLIWIGKDQSKVKSAATATCNTKLQPDCVLLGPSPATMAKISNNWRYSSLLKAFTHKALKIAIKDMQKTFKELKETGVRMDIDIDPRNLM